MTATATGKITQTLRATASAANTTARRLPGRRIGGAALALMVLVAVALLVPLPTAMQLRDWAASAGPWFPLGFLATHIVATVLPFPRTAFTLAAGLLFGPVLGVLLAVVASTLSAVIVLLGVRAIGWQLSRLIRHRAVGTVNARLRERGWLAILSLRLIPAVPFSAINYAAGASAVPVLPYALATVAGLLPGTAAVVILGDALASQPSPLLILVSLCTASVGLAGLGLEIRDHRQQRRALALARSS